MMFVPLALIAIVGSASAQTWQQGTARLNGAEYNCRADIQSGRPTSFVGGAQQFAQCIIAATPDFTSVFNQLASPTGLNLAQFNQYCACWGQQAGYPGVTAVPPEDDFVDCYNQALGGCVNGQAAFDQQDNNIWGAVIRFLGLTNQPANAVALLKSVFTTVDTLGGRQGFRCPYVKSGCVVPTPAPVQPVCPCESYSVQCSSTPCPTNSCGDAGTTTQSCGCIKTVNGASIPVDCCYCSGQPGNQCGSKTTPCPAKPPCTTTVCEDGQWAPCTITCVAYNAANPSNQAGVQTMPRTCFQYTTINGQIQAASKVATGSTACGTTCAPQQRPCTAPFCTTYTCERTPAGACATGCDDGCGPTSVTAGAACFQVNGQTRSQVPPQLCPGGCDPVVTPCPARAACETYQCQPQPLSPCSLTCGNSAGTQSQVSTCQAVAVNKCGGGSVAGYPRAVDSSKCSYPETRTTVEVSLQPQPPIFQPQPPSLQPQQPVPTTSYGQPTVSYQPQQPISTTSYGQPTVSYQPQQPIQVAIASTPTPVTAYQVNIVVTPAPVGATAGFSNAAGAVFDFGQLVVAPVATAAPIRAPPQFALQPVPPVAITIPGQAIAGLQPVSPVAITIPGQAIAGLQPVPPVSIPVPAVAIPQSAVSVPVPRQSTVQVPGCQSSTQPCQVPQCSTYSCEFSQTGACTATCGCTQQSRTQVATCFQVTGGNAATKTPVPNQLCGTSCQNQPIACPTVQPCISYSCSAPTTDPTCYASSTGAAITQPGQNCCSAATAKALVGMRRRAPPNPAQFKCWSDQNEFNARLNAFLTCAKAVYGSGNRGSSSLCNCWTADPIPGTQYGNFWYCGNQLECSGLDVYSYMLQNLALTTYWGTDAITTFVDGKTLRSALLTCPGASQPGCNKDPTSCTGVLRSTSQCLATNQCGGTQQPASASNCQGGCAPSTTPCTVPICTTYSCTYQTVGTCQGTCGTAGSQTRVATCTTDGTGGQAVATSLCGATCTSTNIPCPALPCCPSFSCQVAPFTVCTSSCGDGQRTAVATCANTCGGVQTKVALSACTSAGVACESQSAPCTVCPSLPAVYVPGPAVTVVGAPVTVVGAPVYVQGSTNYVQGSAAPVNPTYNIVPYYQVPSTVQTSTAAPYYQVQSFVQSSTAAPYYQVQSAVQTSTRYVRDSRTGQCIDTVSSTQVSSTLCPTRRSRHAAEDSQAIPFVAALSASGGLMVVIAFVATGVVFVRRTVRKRVELHLAAAAAAASQ